MDYIKLGKVGQVLEDLQKPLSQNTDYAFVERISDDGALVGSITQEAGLMYECEHCGEEHPLIMEGYADGVSVKKNRVRRFLNLPKK